MGEVSIMAQVSILGFAALLLWAAYSDAQSFKIPNRICIAIVLLYPAYVLSTGQTVEWLPATALAAGVLLIGFLLFSMKIVGGGDAKLLAAASLWAGPSLMIAFLFVMAFAGGALAIGYWLHHRFTRAASPAAIFVAKVDDDFGKQPIPYGIAIAAGGLYVAFTNAGLV